MNEMNGDRRLEREIRAALDQNAPMFPPNHLLQSFEFNARRTRRYPRWLALIKEPTMRIDSHVAVGSPTVRVMAILAATLLLTAALAAAGIAGQRLLAADRVIVVDAEGTGDFTTLTDAVASAEDGDEILVMPGTYTESLIIDRDITVHGMDRDSVVISAPDDGPTEILYDEDEPESDPYAVLLRDTNATLRDLTFRGKRSEVFASGGSPTLEGLLFDATGFPFRGSASATGSSIVVTRGSTATIRGNELVGGGPIGVFVGSEPLVEGNYLRGGPHIWGEPGSGAIYRGNTIEEPFLWAIGLFNDEGSPTVEDNLILRPGQSGIEIWAGQPIVRGNTIEGAVRTGINVSGDATLQGLAPVLEGNTIVDAGLWAISVADAEAMVRDNVITGSGITWDAPSGSIVGNSVTEGTAGLYISSGAPLVSDNVIEAMANRGVTIARGASPTLSGNRSCGNGENFVASEDAAISDDGTNEFCEDLAAE
jgi:hypothetical protein